MEPRTSRKPSAPVGRGLPASSLQIDIARRVLDMIRSGAVKAGDHLTEQSLARAYGVSRTPVRHALRLLQERGVVELRAHAGTFVAESANAAVALDANATLAPPDEGEDHLYKRILADRASHQLPQSLSESALAGRYEAPRGCLRRVLLRLTREGLIERRRGHGWTFTPALDTPAAMAESYRFRMILECAGLREPHFAADPEELRRVDFHSSHEALLMEYEHAMTRIDSRTEKPYNVSGHFVWIGERTRQLDGAHVEYFRHLSNPIGVKLGPTATADDALALAAKLNPENTPGRLTFITRFGADKVRDGLPGLDSGDRLPELPARCRIDPAGVEAGIEPIGLVKLDELHSPLDRLTSAVDMGRLGRAGDRHRFQVEPRREAPVQADLLGAEILAPVERGEVEKLELARLLHLVGEGPGEEHIRDVRLDELDRADRMGIGRRFEKFFNPGRSRCHCRHPNTSRWRGRGRGAARSSSMSLPPRCQSAAP